LLRRCAPRKDDGRFCHCPTNDRPTKKPRQSGIPEGCIAW
jgi:hypothetical protein